MKVLVGISLALNVIVILLVVTLFASDDASKSVGASLGWTASTPTGRERVALADATGFCIEVWNAGSLLDGLYHDNTDVDSDLRLAMKQTGGALMRAADKTCLHKG